MNLPQNLAAVNWSFGRSFTSMKFTIDIQHLPLDNNGNIINKGVYFQLYDQKINNTGSYFGFQTNIMRPVLGGHTQTGLFGVIFTRWETRDNDNLRVAHGGFSENSDHEDDFIGVRKPIDFKPGEYTVEIKSGKIDNNEVWYDITVAHEAFGTIDCGGLKFPSINGENIGFNDDGGSWLELYRTNETQNLIRESDIPTWKVIVKSILVDNVIRPKAATLKYPYTHSNGISHVYKSGENEFVFELSTSVVRSNSEGKLF